MSIILFGLKAVGKTTVGSLLADALSRPFDDVDRLIEVAYASKSSRCLTFSDIYQREGKEVYRALEREVILAWQSADAVLSVGGSSLLDDDSYTYLKQQGQLIYLQLSFDCWRERVLRLNPPAYFLRDKDQECALRDYYQRRDPVYSSRADLVLLVDRLSPQQVCAQLQSA